MKSLLTEALRQPPKRSLSMEEMMNRLNRMHIPPTPENRALVVTLIQRGSVNNLRHILNTYNLNMNQYTAFENAWVSHILKNTHTPHQLRRVINIYSKRISPNSKKILENKWIKLLIQFGSAQAIQNALKSNLNNNNRSKLSNVLAIRKLNSRSIHRIIEQLSPARTPMARQTVNSFRRELLLRKKNNK
jgi:hypothetical protein